MKTVEVVIQIPKEEYDAIILQNKVGPKYLVSRYIRAIANGTVLPKGHGALKDVDHYIKMQWEHPDYSLSDDEPTIIEADTESEDKHETDRKG